MAGPRRAVAACVALMCAVAGIAAWRATSPTSVVVPRQEEAATASPAAEETSEATEPATPARMVVHVDGAVVAPGVYSLEGEDLRQRDAVDAAGGLAADADTTSVNLAAPLEDGQKLHVPREGEESSATVAASSTGASASTSATSAGLVNINTATAAELDELPGVGEATAQAIVEERESGGAFASPEDIMRVSGIGEKKYAKMRDRICV